MNKRKITATMLSALVIASFSLMAMASGSDSSGEQEKEKIEVRKNGEEVSGESDQTEPDQTEAKKMSYEISDTSFNYYTDSIGKVEYYGIVEITNTGECGIFLKDCVFDLEDDNGHLLQSDNIISTCPFVIAPGEKGYFYNMTGFIDDSVSFDNGIKLVPNITLEEATGADDIYHDYEISDTDIREGSFGRPKVTGRITNDTSADENLARIYIIFYDADGKVLGISATYVTDLTAGSTQSFESEAYFIDDNVNLDSIADYKVVSRPTYYQF